MQVPNYLQGPDTGEPQGVGNLVDGISESGVFCLFDISGIRVKGHDVARDVSINRGYGV